MQQINKALISVTDKTGIVELANFLANKDIELISVGSTFKTLEKSGIHVFDVSKITGFYDFIDPRLKTVHPIIYGSVIASRTNTAHKEQLRFQGMSPIDLIVVNFLPFKRYLEKSDVNLEETLKEIEWDILSLIKIAVRSIEDTIILTSPEMYHGFMSEFTKNNGEIPKEYKRKLSLTALEAVLNYEIDVYNFLASRVSSQKFLQNTLYFKFKKFKDFKHGENFHQKSAFFFEEDNSCEPSLLNINQIQGRPLTFNNVYDLNVGLNLLLEFDKSSVVVVKHGNPVAVATETEEEIVTDAFIEIRDNNAISVFGSTIVLNSTVEKRLATEIINSYVETILAPRYTTGALEVFATRRRESPVRAVLLDGKKWIKKAEGYDIETVLGGILIQEFDSLLLPGDTHLKIVSKRKPTRKQLADMIFAWKVSKYLKSNSAVIIKDGITIGLSYGQLSRLDSIKMALEKAGKKAENGAIASDTFFPHKESVDEVARYGITGIIQPGGSPRDDEVVMAADEHNIAIAMTNMRHFRH